MTTALRISLARGFLSAAAVLWIAPAPAVEPSTAEARNTADWPQWRGPTRDGIAPAGPKLLDAWPEEGPRLIWKSAPLPSAAEGGSGGVVVTQGRALVLVNARKLVITDEKQLQSAFSESVKDLSNGRDPVPPEALLKLEGKFRTYDEFAKLIQPDRDGGWGHLLQVGVIKKVFRFTDAIVCLDAATGKELWRSEFPGIGGDEAGDMGHFGASGTPAVVGDRVYASGSAGVYCLSVNDGSVIWQNKTDYTHSSPLVAQHAVFVVLHEGLVAFNAQTGTKLWSLPVGGYGNFQCFAPCSSVVEWISGGKSYLVGVAGCGLYCVDPDKGKMLWQEPAAKQWEGSSTPAIHGDLVVVHGDKGVQTYRISPEKADLIWAAGKRAYRAASPLIYQDQVYAITTDVIQCLDLKTGALEWQEKSNGNYCSPILVDGKIIHNTGHAWYPIFTMMFRASGAKFEKLGWFPRQPKLEEYQQKGQVATCSSPTVADGRLYLRCGGGLPEHESLLGDCVACYDLTVAGNGKLVAPKQGAVRVRDRSAKPRTATVSSVAKRDRELPAQAPNSAGSAGSETGNATASRIGSIVAADTPGWSKNWPQFRGPSGDGRADATSDPPAKFNLIQDIRFNTNLPARGRSSPIIWGDQIYLTGEEDCVMALDRADGKLKWNTQLKVAAVPSESGDEDRGPSPGGGSAGGAAPTPVTDGKFVYAFFGNGVLGCVDATGKQVWARRLLAGGHGNMYGLAASPVLYGDLLIQVVDRGANARAHASFVVAVWAKDGTEVWRKDRPASSCWTTPAVVHGPGGDVLVTTAPSLVIAYDPRTGQERWHAEGSSNVELTASPVACGDGVVMLAGSDGLTALRFGGNGDVTKSAPLWTSDVAPPQVASAIGGSDGRCYVPGNGVLTCVDSATGKEKWNLELDGDFWASPILAKDRIYAISRKGRLFVVSIAGRLLDDVQLDAGVDATPAIVQSRLYIRTSNGLLCLGRP